MIRTAIICVTLGLAVQVQAADRPAPDYFIDAVMATTTAKQLALACADISINLPVVSADSGAVMDRLKADGFDTATDTLGMTDPSAQIAAMQVAFLDKHNLQEGAAQRDVCSAARVEMAEGSQIGTYLMEVAQ